ncbi:hypothetical protein CW734_10230 [Planococcus sp. MB-3u-03]|nr:hypothetical protein CW734_10230 [Planococcus sp. MB-3u-03]
MNNLKTPSQKMRRGFFQLVEKVKKSYFPKLIARFPWARAQASSVAVLLAKARSSLADPLESSVRFSKYLERSLIIKCRKTTPFYFAMDL